MQASGGSLREVCKKIEDDINRKIFLKINSLTFIEMIVEEMGCHLDRVEEIRKTTLKWLNLMEFPTKDEIAAIAIKIIKLEHRLDCLDETLYQIQEEIKEYQTKMVDLFVSQTINC